MLEKDLKNVLANSLQLEKELYEFIEECLKRIYPEKSRHAIIMFENMVEGREDWGCLQSLSYIDTHINPQEKNNA